MKYLKLFAILLGAAAFASCSSNDEKPEINKANGVVVSMAQDEISFRENKGIVTVPVKVTGKADGYVVVTCNVAEITTDETDPAMENVHYLMTAKSINIAPGDSVGAFELALVDDKEENNPREFVLTLETAEGATVGAPAQTIVTINDNDHEPYDRLGGEWTIMVGNGSKGTAKFEGVEPGEPGYNEYYTVTGLCGTQPLRCDFQWNEATKSATLEFNYGACTVNYNGSEYEGYFCYLDSEGYITPSGTVRFVWNSEENPDEIAFESGPQGTAADFVVVYNNNGWYLLARTEGVTGFKK